MLISSETYQLQQTDMLLYQIIARLSLIVVFPEGKENISQ